MSLVKVKGSEAELAELFYELLFPEHVRKKLNFWNKSLNVIESLQRNPNKKEILALISEKPIGITEISKKVKLSYKNTYFHIKDLEFVGLVRTDKNFKTQGQKVTVTRTSVNPEDVRKDIEKKLSKLNKVMAEVLEKFFTGCKK